MKNSIHTIFFMMMACCLYHYEVKGQVGLGFNKLSRTQGARNAAVEVASDTNPTTVEPGMVLLANLGRTTVIQPKIELVAAKRFDASSNNQYNLFAESKLFIGSYDSKDLRALFVEDNSTFSFYNTLGWKPFQKEWLKEATTFFFNFSYQGKSFSVNDTVSVHPGIFNAKLGMDIILFRNFSLYGSYNFIQILNDNAGFQKLAVGAESLREQYRFWKVGFQAVLDLLVNQKGTLGINAGFILNNSETKAFHRLDDTAIPVIELKFSTNIK